MRPSVPARQRPASAAAAALLLLAACVPLPGGHSLSTRTVAGEQGENTLVAHDGSTCRVRADTYDATQVGDERTCAWKEVRADGSGRAVPSPRPERGRLPALPGRP